MQQVRHQTRHRGDLKKHCKIVKSITERAALTDR